MRQDIGQGILIGVGLAFVIAHGYARIKATKVNGWVTMFELGVPGNGMLLRAAHAQLFPGPVTVPQGAMYWWTNAVSHVPDMAGRYYSVRFTNPSTNTNFAYVGQRTTGTQAGDFLITRPTDPSRPRSSWHAADFVAEYGGAGCGAGVC